MKSIYSVEVLQQILDHWGKGQIVDAHVFETVGRNTWRQALVTTQGSFELFSYPVETAEDSKAQIDQYLETHHGAILPNTVHSFDRYHLLLQLQSFTPVSRLEAAAQLDLLVGHQLKKSFRVFGSIVQIQLDDQTVMSSYGIWRVTAPITTNSTSKLVVDTDWHETDEIDQALEQFLSPGKEITGWDFFGKWFTIHLSGDVHIHFTQTKSFPALEIHRADKAHHLVIKAEHDIFSLHELES